MKESKINFQMLMSIFSKTIFLCRYILKEIEKKILRRSIHIRNNGFSESSSTASVVIVVVKCRRDDVSFDHKHILQFY